MAGYTAGQRLTAKSLNDTIAGDQIKYKDAGESLVNSTVFQDDNHLTFNVDPSTKYLVQLTSVYTTPAVAGFKCRWVLPSGTLEGNIFHIDSGTADTQAFGSGDGTINGIPGVGTPLPLFHTAVLFVGVTGGTFKWQWAQNVANAGTTSVDIGTRCFLKRIS